MLKVRVKLLLGILQILIITLLITSCASTKKTKYFQDIPDSGALKTIGKAEYTEPKIQVDDILTIMIQTLDPNASQIINMGNIATSATGTTVGPLANSQVISGYLVDKNGDVDLPIVGKTKIAGYTINDAKEIIRAKISKLYNVQSVIVRYANFKISVIGEVNKPGTYIMPNEKVSVLDAIALAGDLTIYGKRENVLLLRENQDGIRIPHRINLRKSDIFTEPFFYLRQNDLIYVEPGKSKAAATDAAQARTYTIIGSLLSVLVVIASRL